MSEIRRGFVRCLWGIPSRAYKRNAKVVNLDLEFIKYNPFDQPFMTYVFGESNLELLHKCGIDNCKLVSKDISLWHWKQIRSREVDQYGHKLAVLQAASNDFDEFVFLDWDCMAVRPLPENFWDSFYSKQSVQAHLRSYSNNQQYIQRKGSIWRSKDLNKRPCASFIYIRGKEIAEKIYNTFLEDKTRSDERVLAIVTDEIMGGWDIEKYWKMFESDHFMLYKDALRSFCYSTELLSTKQSTFLHMDRYTIFDLIKQTKTVDGIDEQRKLIGRLLTKRIDMFHAGLRRI